MPRLLRSRVAGKARDLGDRTHFDGAAPGHGDARRDRDGLVQVRGVDQEEAAQLLARLGKGAVGHEPLALAHPYARRRRGRVQGRRRHELACRVELARQLRGLHITLLALGSVERLLVPVNQQHVFHALSSLIRPVDRRPGSGFDFYTADRGQALTSIHPRTIPNEWCAELFRRQSLTPVATPSGYPPAMAPTMRKGSAPVVTASGTGVSGDSWDRSCSQAKKRRKGRRSCVTWSRIVPRSIGYSASRASTIARGVTGARTSSFSSPPTRASVRRCAGSTTRIMAASALRRTRPREDAGRWAPTGLRHSRTRTPGRPSCPRRRRTDRASRPPSRRAAH